MVLLFISLGAVFGAVFRYFLSTVITDRFGASFPFGILTVNLLGCFLMGITAECLKKIPSLSLIEFRAFWMIGFLSSFTTLSSFSLDCVLLLEKGAYWKAGSYFLASSVLSGVLLLLGMFCVRWM